MGLTKQYLRFEPSAVFGVIGSRDCNISWSPGGVSLLHPAGTARPAPALRHVAAGACQNVHVWDTVTGQLSMVLAGDDSEVTSLAVAADRCLLAAGYGDGSVRVFSLTSGDLRITFKGHRAPVTCVTFDARGMRLASGSKDTEIVVWDIVSEAGLYRLRGHKGVVTQLRFMNNHNCLVSSSKDTFVKFWDLDNHHCFKTLVGHLTEVWDLVLTTDDSLMVTGSGDNELRVYTLRFLAQPGPTADQQTDLEPPSQRLRLDSTAAAEEDQDDSPQDDSSYFEYRQLGRMLRQGKDRVVRLVVDSTCRLLCCHGSDNTLELIYLNSAEQTSQRQQKRLKRCRKRARENGVEEPPADAIGSTDPELQDRIRRLPSIVAPSKLKAVDVTLENQELAKVAVLMANNSLMTYSVRLDDGVGPSSSSSNATSGSCPGARIQLPGHRSDVRALDVSSDGAAIASASSDQLKLWNSNTQQCIGTMPCGPALCVRFVPGDRHALIGCRTGQLQLLELPSTQLLEDVAAHQADIWSLDLTHDQRGFATAGGDKQVKFWTFELVSADNKKQLSFVHTRTHSLDEDCLCVKFSPDGRLVAVALLDSTVKLFFTDSLKLFLSLYGHRLPVLCIDISYDSTIIATGSGDRNIKFWGMDFGDCHKSVFAHDDAVTGVRFLPRTHQLFSCGKDGAVKHWDGDSHQRILTLHGHCRDVLALTVSPDGKMVVTTSRDRSIRLWQRTEEPLVLSEEREDERSREEDRRLATGQSGPVPGERDREAGRAGQKSVETERAAERIMEAIQIYKQFKSGPDPDSTNPGQQKQQLHPLMLAYNCTGPEHLVTEVLRRVKSSELDEALLVMPFGMAMELLYILERLVSCTDEVELVCRCVCFLARVHHGQIVNNGTLANCVDRLRHAVHRQVNTLRDMVGFNLAGLQFLQQELVDREEVSLFIDATQKVRERRRKRKRKEKAIQQAAVLTM